MRRAFVHLIVMAAVCWVAAGVTNADAATSAGVSTPLVQISAIATDPTAGLTFLLGPGPSSPIDEIVAYGPTEQLEALIPLDSQSMVLVGHHLYVPDYDRASIAVIDDRASPLAISHRIRLGPVVHPTAIVWAGGKLWVVAANARGAPVIVGVRPDGSGLTRPMAAPVAAHPQAVGHGSYLAMFQSGYPPLAAHLARVENGHLAASRLLQGHDRKAGMSVGVFSGRGSFLLAGDGPEIHEVGLTDGKQVGMYPTTGTVHSIAVTGTGGGRIAVATSNAAGNTTVAVYRVGSPEPMWQVDLPVMEGAGLLAWSEAGRTLTFAGETALRDAAGSVVVEMYSLQPSVTAPSAGRAGTAVASGSGHTLMPWWLLVLPLFAGTSVAVLMLRKPRNSGELSSLPPPPPVDNWPRTL